MCAHTWAPIKICTHMLVHETPHTRNYTHKAHRCTLIHTKMHKCMPPTHAHQTHTLAFSLSPPLCAPGRPGAQESHLEAGQGAPAAGKRPRVSVCRGLGLSAVCVCLQGGCFWASLAVCRSQSGSPPHCSPTSQDDKMETDKQEKKEVPKCGFLPENETILALPALVKPEVWTFKEKCILVITRI